MYIKCFRKLCFTLLLRVIFLGLGGSTNPIDSFETLKHLDKRDALADLYNSIPRNPDYFVPVGGTKLWHLHSSTAGSYTTAEFYGCTVVVVVDGHNVIIGHYGEVTGGSNSCVTMTDQDAVDTKIMRGLYAQEDLVDFDGTTQAWIINTAGTGSVGYTTIAENLRESGMNPNNIYNYPYYSGSGIGSFPGEPKGKAIVQWTPKGDQSGATLKVYIENINPKFTQDYDCNGNPVPANHKRDGPACGTSIKAEPTTTPLCTYQPLQLPATPMAFCSCGSLSIPVSVIAGTPVTHTSSCAYTTLPPAPTTNSPLCRACNPNAGNGVSSTYCWSITSCIPQTPQATVQVGSSPVHVGTLTSTALYTSISNALTKLCPTVTQTTEMTVCETGSVKIPRIPFADAGDVLNDNGELVVKVESSAYNATSLRDAMIHSAALTAQNSAQNKNCYTANYLVEQLRKREQYYKPWNLARRWLGLEVRERPNLGPEHATWCNAASFAGVNYYSEYARLQPILNSTDYIDASWDFNPQGGEFTCEFIQGLIDALVAVAPEFALGDVELGEAVGAACQAAMNH